MQRILTEKFSFYLVLTSCLMHIFCCGVPLFLSIGSLAAVLGISGSEWLHPLWLETYETGLLVLSGFVLLLTGLIQYIASRINCRTDGDCHHEPCDTKKDYARYVFIAAATIYTLNLLTFLTTH